MASGLDYKDARVAARKLGLSEETMIGLLEAGRLPGLQLGEEWLVSEQVLEEFLSAEQDRQFASRRAERQPPRKARRRREQGTNGALEFVLLGEREVATTNVDALIVILRRLASADPQFLDRFSAEGGRTRKYVARRQQDLYPGRPDLGEFSRELEPGWWVGTNYSRKDIETILKKACRVAGLKWGRDLVLTDLRAKADRAKAMAFVGIAADRASDVARRHDEYFAESLTRGDS